MKNLNLPQELSSVVELAKNYWWSWNQESYEIFKAFSPEKWQETRTPYATLKDGVENHPEKVTALAKDKEFLSLLNTTTEKMKNYVSSGKHPKYKTPESIKGSIAYFCAEYGIHESLPIYSGGLGVLAGDHVKSASDLGLPLLFVGLYYKNGYFTQEIDSEGQQQDIYNHYSPEELGLDEVQSSKGEKLMLNLDLGGREVKVQVWKAQIGRVPLYLLDSNVEGNSQEDKDLTARLYGGDREMRISQEIILGIGGVQMLEALDIHPQAYHMNEGHSGFFQLERIKNEMKRKNLSFEEAKILCSSNCLFTTHTPVPAGNEAFTLPLMHKYFHNYIKELDISWHRFVSLGLVEEQTDNKFFSLTVFAINVSRFYNGVSALHGKIAKRMWSRLWKDVPTIDNPISSITNGVHTQTWMARDTKDLLESCFGGEWKGEIINQDFWNKVIEIPNDKIISMKQGMKKKMIDLVRERQS
ncbi:MAG: alpha-glucan family phosphorylase, partial [Halobacteriovoraceae bacterium]|nr:alpha-glucan family phosphorylase [Halobacteriovoraceae bacterium]